jgi:hypothetical protein
MQRLCGSPHFKPGSMQTEVIGFIRKRNQRPQSESKIVGMLDSPRRRLKSLRLFVKLLKITGPQNYNSKLTKALKMTIMTE